MDFEEQNDLLQDYRYRKHILEEISLTKIKEWNNADWNNIINKPTTLDGYGITDSLKVVDGVVKNTDELKWIDSLGGISSSYCNGQNNSYVGLDNGSLNIVTNIYDTTKQNYVSFNSISLRKGIMLTSYDGVVLTTNTKLYIGENSERDIDIANRLEVIQKSNNNLLFGNTRIPNKMNNVLNIPRIDILNNSDVVEGGLWNSTYNINNTVKDGLHLTHEASKYAVLGYYNTDSKVYNSYMIMDYYGVLKTGSEGDEWAPIRFEQDIYSRHNIRMGSMSDIIIGGKSLLGRLSNCEKVIADGTGIVDWVNVKNKPTTFAPSSHGHVISDITSLQSNLDSKVGTSGNYNITGELNLGQNNALWGKNSDGIDKTLIQIYNNQVIVGQSNSQMLLRDSDLKYTNGLDDTNTINILTEDNLKKYFSGQIYPINNQVVVAYINFNNCMQNAVFTCPKTGVYQFMGCAQLVTSLSLFKENNEMYSFFYLPITVTDDTIIPFCREVSLVGGLQYTFCKHDGTKANWIAISITRVGN